MSPVFAIADDLTGAAEAAALGYRRGLRTLVVTGAIGQCAMGELVVYDTDSRLDAPDEAARKVRLTTRCLTSRVDPLVYKKTDSVLRGAVLAEVEAFAAELGRPRVLLVPANPGLGRTIRDGNYAIGGVPVHETAFAQDPSHPRTSCRVVEMLGPPRQLPVAVLPPGAPLPAGGVVVGEATTADDLARWAGCVDATTVAAGGSEFFGALLAHRGITPCIPAMEPPLGAPLLVVSGTTTPTSRAVLGRLCAAGVPVIPVPETLLTPARHDSVALHHWIETIEVALASRGLAVTIAPGKPAGDPAVAAMIREAFAAMAKRLHERRAFAHLVIEGGATAAAITQALGWYFLEVTNEWTPGVITLRPLAARDRQVTLKPGSYPWPAAWWDRLTARAASTPPAV
jgi:D-threonate/D-erythronate kinase